MLVLSLPSCLLRPEGCLQVCLSGLSTKAQNNLTFLLDRLNLVRASVWLPRHTSSLCFWTVRKAAQFILLVNSCHSCHPLWLTHSNTAWNTLPSPSCPFPSPPSPKPFLLPHSLPPSSPTLVKPDLPAFPAPMHVKSFWSILVDFPDTLRVSGGCTGLPNMRAVTAINVICWDSPYWFSRLSRRSLEHTSSSSFQVIS